MAANSGSLSIGNYDMSKASLRSANRGENARCRRYHPPLSETAVTSYKDSTQVIAGQSLAYLYHIARTMSATYLTYNHPPFPPTRDPMHYDMAVALELKPMPSYSMDPFAMQDLQRRLPHHMLHPVHDPPQSFYDGPPPLSHDPYAPGIPLYDVHEPHDLMHPAPVRPITASQLFPGSSHMDGSARSFDHQESPVVHPEILEPSQFVTEHPRPAVHETESSPSQPPPPPPSWAMSGSLDPATGIYQTAPEHPRVRTAQACEKCRGRKAKVCCIMSYHCASYSRNIHSVAASIPSASAAASAG